MRLIPTTLLTLCLCCAVAASVAAAPAAAPELAVKGDTLVIAASGKKVDVVLEKAENAPLRYACVDAEAAKTHKIAKGVYLFDAAGKQTLRCMDGKNDDPAFVGSLSVSPGGALLAVDAGTSHVRGLSFIAPATGKRVGKELIYFSGEGDLVWRDKDSVLVMVIGPEAKERAGCGFEECESPISVASYTPATGAQKLLYPFDPLCNTMLEGYKDNVLTVSKECRTVEQWKNPDVPEPAKQRLTYTFTAQ